MATKVATKKAETFAKEIQLLERAKNIGNIEEIGIESYQDAFGELVNGYEDLLNEAKFLTKVSDRLEKKLSKANDELAMHNQAITAKNEGLSRENKTVKAKHNQMVRENKKLDKRLSKFQIAVMVIIFLVVMIILGGLYILFGDGTNNGLLNG